MARHGGRSNPRPARVGGNPPPVPRDVLVSKKLSWILRHGAVKEGLKLDESGYANCGELLSWPPLRSLSVTFPELQSLVATNDKQRFQLIPRPTLSTSPSSSPLILPILDPLNPSHHLIRASQGHSLQISSAAILSPLDPKTTPDFPNEVVHGTYAATWPKILASGGLKPMGRTHIHFSTGLPDTQPGLEAGEAEKEKVVSGMRKGANVLVWVDVRKSVEEGGLKWWRSANGVVLTQGDASGVVGLEWCKKVVDRKSGNLIWEPAGAAKGKEGPTIAAKDEAAS